MIFNGKNMVEQFITPKVEPFRPYSVDSFACKCDCGTNYIDNKFIDFANNFFNKNGFMLTINSGCRCEKHNKSVAGKQLSKHIAENGKTMGTACDFDYMTIDERNLIIFEAIKFGFRQIILYIGAKTFIHIGSECNSNFNIFLVNQVILRDAKKKIYEYDLL